jgi:hypothetical protein
MLIWTAIAAGTYVLAAMPDFAAKAKKPSPTSTRH